MPKIVYYTSGISGSGRVVTGISIGNAFRRRGIPFEFTIVSGSYFSHLVKDYNHIKIPIEEADALSIQNYRSSELWSCLQELKPDVLLVDLLWFPLYHFINELECKKIFLCRRVKDFFFSMNLPGYKLQFDPGAYDSVIATEPFESIIEMIRINPIVIRNHDEILPRNEALERLGVKGNKPVGLFAYNGNPGEYETIKKKYDYLEDAGYRMIYSTNYSDKGLFPIVDYYNAIDFIVSGAGYNSFWETRYFNKDAVYEPVQTQFEDQEKRIMECSDYTFTENGADQLVEILLGMV